MTKRFSRPALSVAQLKKAFEDKEALSKVTKGRLKKQAAAVLWYLDRGLVRVWDAETKSVQVWVKEGILAYFRAHSVTSSSAGCFEYQDKIPIKPRSSLKDVRVVPGAVLRHGSFLEPGVVCMPCFVNTGAYIGKNSMVDTWATVGSCAQIGEGVHLSGGVGIGGVLEPAQAQPVIVEDGVFIGSRAIIVEGVYIEKEAVIGAGVTLTASTKIVDVRGSEPVISSGRVPARAVVIPGTLPKKFSAGEFGVPCALIIGTRSASTDLKVSLNSALRDHSVAV